MLTLPEEVLLLALRDKEGTAYAGASYHFALGAALVAELLLQGRIRVLVPKKPRPVRQRLVDVVSREPVGDPLLDEALERVAQARRRASVGTWVSRLAGTKRLKRRVAEQLVDRGVLRAKEASVLLFFTRTVYPARDQKPERELRQRLRRALFSGTKDLDARTVVLIALAHPTGLLRANFDKKRLKDRKQRIAQIVAGNVVGEATQELMEAVQGAIVAAAAVSTVTTTATR
jgi:hypothetical protein